MVFISQLTGLLLANQEVLTMPKKQEKRNGHAFHPIMSKGGAHEKTEKAKRKAAKHDLNRKVNEWLGRSSLAA
jgi:hypothetical protein